MMVSGGNNIRLWHKDSNLAGTALVGDHPGGVETIFSNPTNSLWLAMSAMIGPIDSDNTSTGDGVDATFTGDVGGSSKSSCNAVDAAKAIGSDAAKGVIAGAAGGCSSEL